MSESKSKQVDKKRLQVKRFTIKSFSVSTDVRAGACGRLSVFNTTSLPPTNCVCTRTLL